MQILIQVVCTRGPSLRDAISKNTRLDRHLLRVSEQKRSGRSHGWTKVHSTEPGRRGAINLEWDANTNLLLARVITRGKGKPSLIIGDFVDLLMSKYRNRIQAINIIPRG
jgi:hypothetical protein